MRPEYSTEIKLYGRVENHYNDQEDWVPLWTET